VRFFILIARSDQALGLYRFNLRLFFSSGEWIKVERTHEKNGIAVNQSALLKKEDILRHLFTCSLFPACSLLVYAGIVPSFLLSARFVNESHPYLHGK
jgi:hypothetical protein